MEVAATVRLEQFANYVKAERELKKTRLWPTVCLIGARACQVAVISARYGHRNAERFVPRGD